VLWRGEAIGRMTRCLRPVYLDQMWWVIAGVGLLFGLAGLLYLVHPWWLIRRGRLTRLREDDGPELVAELAGLSRLAGLAREPVFLLGPRPRVGGQAFGRVGRRYVRLNAGLTACHTTDPALFRAVVLHELAHLRNRDVDQAYLARAIWWSFLALALA